jgi:hypothetical protein
MKSFTEQSSSDIFLSDIYITHMYALFLWHGDSLNCRQTTVLNNA